MLKKPLLMQPQRAGLNAEQRHLLRRVSRSFDLSIRLLPAALQAPVAVGYLLARATDTVADTTALPLAKRQDLLTLISQAIDARQACTTRTAELNRLTQAFAAQQTDPHERALMQALPQCLPLLHTLTEADQTSVRQVLRHITHGQQLDMTRFGPGLQALQTEAELAHYTWLVAGCVGEFWTELCGRHLPGYSHLPQAEMMRIGREYGMGLQRLNIIRDAGADLAAGRCYWPVETLAQAGLTPAMLARAAHIGPKTGDEAGDNTGQADALHALTPLYNQWLDHTQAQLADGMRYALSLKPLRLRLASALPALIGARTLARLRQAGPAALTQHIKMPRHEMRAMLWRIALGCGSGAVLNQQFQKMSGLPRS
ncbi:squalene/phytoene synthase family protein [Limnohabitans sp. Rim8]|uniref:phytoene/squalene synthase family protein n=1 Tax=Limnohabitans sp. Rim8 TaxID=1100718 RepID=UPI0025CF0968|nr:squalene/phytoene synthase family protein [Limnohabitans sp. Rim8]